MAGMRGGQPCTALQRATPWRGWSLTHRVGSGVFVLRRRAAVAGVDVQVHGCVSPPTSRPSRVRFVCLLRTRAARSPACVRVACEARVGQLVLVSMAFVDARAWSCREGPERCVTEQPFYTGPRLTQAALADVLVDAAARERMLWDLVPTPHTWPEARLFAGELSPFVHHGHTPVHTVTPAAAQALAALLECYDIDDDMACLVEQCAATAALREHAAWRANVVPRVLVMRKFVLDAKANLRIGAKVDDEDYNARAAAMSELQEGMRACKHAMQELMSSMKSLMSATEKLSRAFTQLDEAAQHNNVRGSSSGSVVGSRGSNGHINKLPIDTSFQRIAGDFFALFRNVVETVATAPLNDLRDMYQECERVRGERTKSMHKYTVYRSEVEKKERECGKRGKDPTLSRTYLAEVAKRDELQAAFIADNDHFKSAHTKLGEHSCTATRTCVDAFLKASYDFCYAVAAEIHTMIEATTPTTQPVFDEVTKP